MNNDFTIIDFEKAQRGGRRVLQDNEATIKDDGHNRVLYINTHVRDIVVKAGCTKLRIRKDNLLGNLHLIFGREQGLQCSDKKNAQLCYANKQLVEFLFKELGFAQGSGIYKLELGANLSTNPDYYIYGVKAAQQGESGTQRANEACSELFGY